MFAFKVAKTAKTQINQQRYNKSSKCPPSVFTQARGRFLKFAIDLQIASCGKSFQIFISTDFSSGTSFSCGFRCSCCRRQTLWAFIV